MSPYAAPTSLAGGTVGSQVNLSWNPSIQTAALLLHGDGVNGSGTITDDSGNYVLASTGITNDTSLHKFGTGALNYNTGGPTTFATSTVANGSPLDFQSGDFTIEFWFQYTQGEGLNGGVISNAAATDGWQVFHNIGLQCLQLNIVIGGTGYFIRTPTVSFTLGLWQSVSFVRQGTNLYAFYNGAVNGPAAIPAGAINNVGTLRLGSIPGVSQAFNGAVDELRIVNSALYTANYTPATAAFSAINQPPGYDVYRNGVSIATYIGSYAYNDTPPGVGTYTYTVAASDGTVDISAQSAPLVFYFGPTTFFLQPKFVPALDFKAIMIANPGYINPRVYEPAVDTTVRITK